MADYDVLLVNLSGVDLIIIPLDSSFGSKSSSEQQAMIDSLQSCATLAELEGTVVPVWDSNGQMMFIAPPNCHPFFNRIDLGFVQMNLSERLTCG